MQPCQKRKNALNLEKAKKYAFCATGIPITSAAHVHNIITLYNNDNIVCRYLIDRYYIQRSFYL